MNNQSYISRLIYLHLTGTATPQEEAELRAWLDENESNRRFFDGLTSPEELSSEMMARKAIDVRRPLSDMSRRIAEGRRHRLLRISLQVAAALLLLLGLGTIWHYSAKTSLHSPDAPLTAETPAPLSIDDISAGTTRATITDDSGHAVVLTGDESGQSSGALLANTSAGRHPRITKELCLDVPRGGEFKIVLEDSTEVWLNAQSTLRYPETFSHSERRVSVSGEAYFKVHRELSRPFYVETDRQVIRVYGTTFNVRSYSDEEAIYTTLETGSISLTKAGANTGELFLSSGHQAVLTRDDDRVKLSVVDPSVVTSWRHGRFVFEDQTLERIMRDMSRWYNFEYDFADPTLGERVFMGSIERYADFRTAIQVLENCGGISFSVTPDNKVLISAIK